MIRLLHSEADPKGQAGIIAAAGMIALEQMVDRLAEDHKLAQELAQKIDQINGVVVDDLNPKTNMVYFSLNGEKSISPGELVKFAATS